MLGTPCASDCHLPSMIPAQARPRDDWAGRQSKEYVLLSVILATLPLHGPSKQYPATNVIISIGIDFRSLSISG